MRRGGWGQIDKTKYTHLNKIKKLSSQSPRSVHIPTHQVLEKLMLLWPRTLGDSSDEFLNGRAVEVEVHVGKAGADEGVGDPRVGVVGTIQVHRSQQGFIFPPRVHALVVV